MLAFVFAASVIWLLLDMAALRLSLNDVNSQLLKERVIREREVSKQQSRGTQLARRGFRHPVQRVHPAVTHAGKGPLSLDIKLSQVYRQGDKKGVQMLAKREFISVKVLKADRSKSATANHQDKAAQQNVTSTHGVAAKKIAVNLDLNGAEFVESKLMNVAASNVTQRSPGAQKNLHAAPPTSEKKKKPTEDTHEAEKPAHKPDLKTESGSRLSQPQDEEAHLVKTTSKPPNKDVKEEANINEDKNLQRSNGKSRLIAVTEALKPPSKPQTGDNSTARRHKVLSLDVTLTPRDVNAVGQFGQAALVASNEDTEVRKRWDEGHFNVYLSDKIPVDRAIPDTRPKM